jgi:hypothetical protein
VDPDSPNLAILQAELDNTAQAERFLAAHGSDNPDGTVMQFVSLPRVGAAVAVEDGKPLDALNALDPARRIELADYTVLSERGAACLLARRSDLAVHEYQKILANRGIVLVSVLNPLARLGLARLCDGREPGQKPARI